MGQGISHVQGQGAILGAVGLVGDDYDVVALGVALGGIYSLVELLDEGEDVGFMLGEEAAQVFAAGGTAGLDVVVHHAAAGKSLVELGVQVLAIGEHQEGEGAANLSMHLAGEHDHGIALACALGVPEDAQLSRHRFALADLLHSLVHPHELMVSRQDLPGLTTGLIREYENQVK